MVLEDTSEEKIISNVVLTDIVSLLKPNLPSTQIDIGANDGVLTSNSRYLIGQDWTTVLVEPNPEMVSLLKNQYGERGGVLICDKAVSDQQGKMTLHGHPAEDRATTRLMSSFYPMGARNKWEVEVITFKDLIANYPSVFDNGIGILSVDTEGHDIAVLRSMLQQPIRPWIVISEFYEWHDPSIEGQKQIMLQNGGYRYVLRLGRNEVYVWTHKERQNSFLSL